MGAPYIGEVRMIATNFVLQGWLPCDGQYLNPNDNNYSELFAVIGTTYGGDGVTTFRLPVLTGSVVVSVGTSSTGTVYAAGETGGVASVALTTDTMAAHVHTAIGDSNSGTTTTADPTNALYGNAVPAKVYSAGRNQANLHAMATTIGAMGGGQPHDNTQPSLAITFMISYSGIFPQKPQ